MRPNKTTMDSLLDEFRAAMAADEDSALTCPVCGALGLEPCDLRVHVVSLAGFAAANARAHRQFAVRRDRETP